MSLLNPPPIDIRLEKEQEEKKRKGKEKAEACPYTIIKVAHDEDLGEQIGKEIYLDLVDHDKEEVAKAFGIPVQFQRYWLWAKRQNHTYRPDRPLTAQEEIQSVGELREVSNKWNSAELKLFLEVELCLDLRPLAPPGKSKEEILLFFKLYDPLKENIRYVGRLFVKGSGKPLEILAKLNELAGFSPDEEIELFEEITFEPNVICEHINRNLTFRGCQLEDGDIICFQKSLRKQGNELYCFPEVPSFLEYVHNRQVVRFRSLEKPTEDEFSLELSKQNNYDEVVECLARHLPLDDPSKVRLTSHNCYSQQPKPQPISYRGVDRLAEMLSQHNQTSDILYYEVLDIPLPELQGFKTLRVAFYRAAKDEVTIHFITLPKQSTAGDVLNDLKTKVELSRPDAELRLLGAFHHKIYKIFPLNDRIVNINDKYWTLRAEEIPEEEKNLDPHSRLIPVYHFMKDTAQNQARIQNFGEPFFLVIHEDETLAEVKARIQKKLQVSDEAFSKWKFAFLSLGHPEYLQDSDIVFNRFQKIDVYGTWEQYLGLEHTDTPTSASSSASSTNAVNASIRVSPSPFAFGASSASSQTSITAGIFGSNWQAPKSSGFSSPFSSATPNAFSFGASSSFFTAPTTTVVAFGSAPITPSGPAFSFDSTWTNSSSQPIVGHSPGGFMFGSTPSPYQFGGQQSQPAAQNPSPFAASGILGAGGSFSLSSNVPNKSGQKIVKVTRNKNRRN